MNLSSVNLFLALLSLGGAAAVLLGISASIARWSVAGNSSVDRLVVAARPLGLPLAFLAAATAMFGSLYYSEVADFEPCRLCWIQRFFMYPAAGVLGLSLLIRKERIAWLAAVLAVPGLGVSLYHRLEQQFPDSVGGACELDNPCSGRWVDTFGFITIPTMAAVAFAIIVIFVPFGLLGPKEEDHDRS